MVSKINSIFWIIESLICIIFIISGVSLSLIRIIIHDQTLILFINFSFIEINATQYRINIRCDWKFLSLGAIICIITRNIILYRKTYINSDKFKFRFIIVLSLFATSILWTIISRKNILTILVGWDFLGLTSLLLIMHYQRNYVYSNSILTFILNRLGDIAFIIASAFILRSGRWSFYCTYENKIIILFLIATAAFTKSAQLPFSSWLPKAIAAPTPVSSLVHSSTLVTAGVILLIRVEPLIKISSLHYIFITVSIFTILTRSLAGCLRFDLKKIIAFSTIRQIRFIIIVLIIGRKELAFLHLLIHALFKSLIFIAAGTIIHHSGGEQDIRKISNIKLTLPLESTIITLSIITLIGFPFLSGFYSKDLIIEYYSNNLFRFIISRITDLCICLTSFYSIRVIIYVLRKKIKINILLNWSTRIYEKIVILIFFIPIIIIGRILRWNFIKIWRIDFPIHRIKKSFGLWCFLFTISLFFILIKIKYLNTPSWDLFRSITYINHLMYFIINNTLIIRIYCNNFYENIWNKFLTVNLIINIKKTIKPTKKIFNPWLIIEFLILNITIIITFINY